MSVTTETVLAPAERLGHVLRAADAFEPARLARWDEAEEFPDDACRVLDDFGLAGYYVPASHGGRLGDLAGLVELLRAVARCDLTVAIAHGKTFLGAVSTWVAGTPEQAAWLGRAVLDGDVVSWGLTEWGHGSDLMAGELTATRCAGGWRLDGAKWLINNATRGHQVCVLARTAPEGGPRGFSLFMVDKRRLAPDSYRCLPKEHTHGIRGADISGIAFDGAVVPADAVVGDLGTGVETVLKALQLTRTVCASLSLGAADHALRLTADLVADREVYGKRMIDLPRVRVLLGRVCASLLLAEVTSTVAARSASTLTGELSVVSAITKALVPSLVEDLLDEAGDLLGVRSYLTEAYAEGMFAKLERDHRIVGLFDGSTLVNRSALIAQFPVLARRYRQGRYDAEGVAAAAGLDVPLAEPDVTGLRLLSTEGCSIVATLPTVVERVRDQVAAGALPPVVGDAAERLLAATEDLHRELVGYVSAPRDVDPAAFGLAERYELCFAGAACLQVWVHNRAAPGRWRDGVWLRACLDRVLALLGAAVEPDDEAYDQLTENYLGTAGAFDVGGLAGGHR